nr:LamG domain-containing protein [Kiritimatiellia bacterium]
HANPDAGCTIYVNGATESSGGSVPSVFATATWVHVVWVLESNSTVSMYKNGVRRTLNNGGTYNAPSENGEPLVIGRAPTSPSSLRYYHGLIDEVRIYSRPLTETEVGMLYRSTFVGAGASNGQMCVEIPIEMTGETTIRHLIRQGDVDMGVYTNGP